MNILCRNTSRLFCAVFLLFGACTKPEPLGIGRQNIKRPVYIPEADFYNIRNIPQQNVSNTGTILIWQQYFFIVERLKGIHVYDRADPANPVYITFLSIPGCSDCTISSNTLFADNGRDLISINISEIRHVIVNKILKGATGSEKNYPDHYKGYFECIDLSKGIVVGWEDAVADNPQCIVD